VGFYEESVRLVADTDELALWINTLIGASEAHLATGNPAAALIASERAAAIHRAHDFAAIQGIQVTGLWWQHHRALRANGKTAAARRALATAYRFLVERVSKLTDEGLRRNYFNKPDIHRKIVELAERKVPTRRPAHLPAGRHSRNPSSGYRHGPPQNEPPRDELQEFLIDEATELSGAERVPLVLASADGPQLAGSLPRRARMHRGCCGHRAHARKCGPTACGEPFARPPAPELAQSARDRRAARRTHDRRPSHADIGGAFGRFHDADRDLLAMLASRALSPRNARGAD
jgi:hypothetical protein